ncbi:GDP-mannose 4,6-dehydratase, partial [Streptomyces sp. NPDC050804]
MSKRALITGITGQDGSYLAEHLLSQGYQVWGLIRGQANPRKSRVSRLVSELSFVDGDLMDQGSLVSAVDTVQPDEVYNLGAISFVPMSWQQAELV